jgi:crossover junction endodeoxyribonuclease RuvC
VGESVPNRLVELQSDIRSVLRQVNPEVVAVERVLFQVNVQTAMGVGQASGIVMAESARTGANVIEYSPNQVKLAVAGHGKADKEEVGEMVRRLLALSAVPEPADAADAAAIALCHAAFAGHARPVGSRDSRERLQPSQQPARQRSNSRRPEVEGPTAERPIPERQGVAR